MYILVHVSLIGSCMTVFNDTTIHVAYKLHNPKIFLNFLMHVVMSSRMILNVQFVLKTFTAELLYIICRVNYVHTLNTELRLSIILS